MKDYVVLVDENDRQLGIEEKIAAHENGGKLHRALSVNIYNSNNQLLIQQRASVKHSFTGIWSNAACSHPKPDEDTLAAAKSVEMEYESVTLSGY